MYTVIVFDGRYDSETLSEKYRKTFRAHERSKAEILARTVTMGIGGKPCAQVWQGDRFLTEENSASRRRWLLSVAKWAA